MDIRMSRFEPGITVVIPTIPPRRGMLHRATDSVARAIAELPERKLSVSVDAIIITDRAKLGAASTRDTGLRAVETEWVAFLDDDDEMLPNHLAELYSAALTHPSCPDYLWSQFQIIFPPSTGRIAGPGPHFLGQKAFEQWNDDDPCQTTITTLVKTELALDAGGFVPPAEDELVDGNAAGEDFRFTMACRAAGGTFRHVPEVTWHWHHHNQNTSGRPDRW
jgi:hypothetical protein